MSTFENEEREIEVLMKEASNNQEIPGHLKSKLQSQAASVGKRHSVWPSRLAMAGVAAVALLAFGLSMAPKQAEAKTFQHVLNATQELDTFQIVLQTHEGGKPQEFTMAIDEQHFTMLAGDGVIIQFDHTAMKIYDPKKNEVMEMSFGGLVDPKVIAAEMKQGIREGLQEADLKQALKEYEQEFGKENIKIGPIVHRNGRSFYDVRLEKAGEDERVFMTVDADTDLPHKIEVEKNVGGKWELNATMEMRFGEAIDPKLRNVRIPSNAKKVGLDFGKMMQGDTKDIEEFGKNLEKNFSGSMFSGSGMKIEKR